MSTQNQKYIKQSSQGIPVGKTSQVTNNNLEAWRQLEGKVVFVTGASAGLGKEFCLDLARAGCRIAAAARRADRLKSLCDDINNGAANSHDFVRAVAIELDVTADEPTIEACVKKAWDAFGHIDTLVNNAGIRGPIKSAVDLSEDEWCKTIRTNLTGSWLVSKHVGARIKAAKRGGSVINISSVSGLNSRTEQVGGVAYSCSKAAMNCMTKVMALELGKHSIRVNAIAPSLFKSEITESLFQTSWLERVLAKTIPLKTFGTSDPALTSLVRFLVHDSSEYVSGNIFIVDAGVTLVGFPIFSSL